MLSGGVSVKDDTVFLDKLAMKTAETSITVDGAIQQYLSTPVFNLQATADPLSLPEIARIVPALAGIRLQPTLAAKTSGPLDRLALQLNVQSSAGAFSGTMLADLVSPGQSVKGDLSVRQLDLAPLLNDPAQKSDITANAHVDLHGEALSNISGLHGDMVIDAPRIVAAGYVAERIHAKAHLDGRLVDVDGRAAAYGADATVAGRVTLPPDAAGSGAHAGAIAYDLHGVARHVDARKLPRDLHAPPASTDVNAAFHVTSPADTAPPGPRKRLLPAGARPTATAGSVAAPPVSIRADLRFEPSTIAGAHVAAGDTAEVVLNGSDVSYTADVNVTGLDLQALSDLQNHRLHFGSRGSTNLEPEIDVVAHIHVRKERIGLEHHGDVALLGGEHRDVAAADR